jgi:hypothetical protein
MRKRTWAAKSPEVLVAEKWEVTKVSLRVYFAGAITCMLRWGEERVRIHGGPIVWTSLLIRGTGLGVDLRCAGLAARKLAFR